MPRPFPTQPNLPVFVPSFVPVVTSPVSLANVRKSNRVKYDTKGKKAALVRVGDLGLQFRALLAKNGVTTIEATTGIFEEQPGRDIIQRTQLRVLTAPSAEPTQAWPNAPYWAFHQMGLARGDQLYLQANVKATGVSRTEIMRVQDTVLLRPDIKVVSVDAAATATTNMPVAIFATVAEGNGDVDARASCVLSVDGMTVDQATAIWVAAGDVVTCQFAYVFAVAGTHTIAVSATDVSPGDWDDANNGAMREITIAAPGTPIGHGQIDVFEEAYDYLTTMTRTGDHPIEGSNGGSQQVSKVSFFGKAVQPSPAPVQRVDARFTVGSRVIFESSVSQFQTFQYVNGGAQVVCATYNMNQHNVMSCTSTFPDGSGKTEMSYSHSSGTVTYYGQTLWCNLGGCNTFGGPWSGSDVTGTGQRYGLAVGDELRLQLTYVDAGGTARVVDKVAVMEDHSAEITEDVNVCDPNHWEGLGTVCTRIQSWGMLLKTKLIWGDPFGTP
ncbi:MAG: hypothetical protein ACREOK_03870 [Gemmatimonadaceae bacterium]